jgi:ABC-type transport system involved in multi-copper enzyme maturation permease subunit
MKTRLNKLLRWLVLRVPEALLAFFVISLVPMVVLVALQAKQHFLRLWAAPLTYWEEIVHNPWPAAAVTTCVLGALVLLFLLWRNWGLVWAVARKMIIEAMHRRLVLVLLIFFVVLTLSLPFILKTEGTLKSQVQLAMFYSLVLAMVLLSLVAIFLSAASICSEIERKQVHITDTKPLRRWQFLLGKWFGVVVMCMAILFVMATTACVLVLVLADLPDTRRMLPREVERLMKDYRGLRTEVLVARRSFLAREPADVSEDVEKRFQELLAEGKLEDNIPAHERARRELRRSFLAEWLMVKPGGRHWPPWRFDGLRPQEDGTLHVRFKAYTSTVQGRLIGAWFFLRREQVKGEDGEMKHVFKPLGVAMPPPQGWFTGTPREFAIPADYVAEDGSLFMTYENMDNRATAVFDPDVMIEVLQKEGEFLPNYYRVLLVMLCHIALLAALGLMAGSLLSFPVATLTVAFFVVVGLTGPWFVSFLEPISAAYQYTPTEEMIQVIWRGFLKSVLAVVPHFGEFNPLADLTDGKMVSWTFVSHACAMMVCIKGGLALLIGMYLYGRRELARVIV